MLYEYRCRSCGNIIEANHSISINPKRMLYCPRCERMRSVKRIISKTSFVLKGDAWARDGYTKEKTCTQK